MKKLLKKIRGTWDPGDFYIEIGGIVLLFLVGIVYIILGWGEQKWVGVIGILFALEFLIIPRLIK